MEKIRLNEEIRKTKYSKYEFLKMVKSTIKHLSFIKSLSGLYDGES